MKILDRSTANDCRARIAAISADSKRQWGTMSPAQMLAHLRKSVEVSIGEIAVKDQSNFLIRLAAPVLFSGLLSLPKNVKTHPVYVVDSPDAVDAEKSALQAAVGRFLDYCDAHPDVRPLHPLFGPLSIRLWQKGHGIHFDHHLRQFGA